MFQSKGLLDNNQRAAYQWFGFSQSVGDTEQLRQIVEMESDSGMFRAEALMIAKERRIIGSASPTRFVSLSTIARLVRSLATVAMFQTIFYLINGQRAAHHRFRFILSTGGAK